MLAGVWVLVLVPLMDALNTSGWSASLRVPAVLEVGSAVRTLDETFLFKPSGYPFLTFCIGVVLLFSKERGRRAGRLDWTRRWGVICSYAVLLIEAAGTFFVSALVLVGIAALFLSMPLRYQPGVTDIFVSMGTAYLRYGPAPKVFAGPVCVAFSSIVILLACVPLYDALRCSGPKRLAAILPAALALFALMHIGETGLYCLGLSSAGPSGIYRHAAYFSPPSLVQGMAGLLRSAGVLPSVSNDFLVETVKWCVVLGIAVWLSVAQVAGAATRRVSEDRKNVSEAVDGNNLKK